MNSKKFYSLGSADHHWLGHTGYSWGYHKEPCSSMMLLGSVLGNDNDIVWPYWVPENVQMTSATYLGFLRTISCHHSVKRFLQSSWKWCPHIMMLFIILQGTQQSLRIKWASDRNRAWGSNPLQLVWISYTSSVRYHNTKSTKMACISPPKVTFGR